MPAELNETDSRPSATLHGRRPAVPPPHHRPGSAGGYGEGAPAPVRCPPASVTSPMKTGRSPSAPADHLPALQFVARMTELLRLTPTDRVLEIGTGSGYQAAVLAELAGEVWERRAAHRARRAGESASRGAWLPRTCNVIAGAAPVGLPVACPLRRDNRHRGGAPFVPDWPQGAASPSVGRMVIPVASGLHQDLLLIRTGGFPRRTRLPLRRVAGLPRLGERRAPGSPPDRAFRETSVLACVFVPLIGEQGYPR